jgi:hypothetical protein
VVVVDYFGLIMSIWQQRLPKRIPQTRRVKELKQDSSSGYK